MKKTIAYVIFVIGSSIAILAALAWFLFFFTTTNNSLTDYTQRRSSMWVAQDIMPDLRDLPVYETIYYQYRHKKEIIFFPETMLLVVRYDEATYQAEKEKLSGYEYLDKAVYDTSMDAYILPEPEFQINSFNFRVFAEKEKSFYYPQYIRYHGGIR